MSDAVAVGERSRVLDEVQRREGLRECRCLTSAEPDLDLDLVLDLDLLLVLDLVLDRHQELR